MLDRIRRLTEHSGFKRYLKNTSWLFGEKLLRIVAAITIGVWVTRYLGPSDYGILSYAISFVGIFAAFSSLGLNGILSRELVREPQNKNLLIGTTFILQTIGSSLLMLFLIISIYLNDNKPLTNKIIIILGLLTFLSSFNVIVSYFESVVKSKFIVIINFINLIISSAIKVALILTEAPLIYFVYVLAFDALFLALGAIFVYKINDETLRDWKFSKNMAKDLLKDSWPLILNTIFISIYIRIDQVMIKEVMNTNAVGQYAAAVTISQAWYFIPTIVCSSLFPAIVNAKKHSISLYQTRLQRLYNLMVVLSLSIAIPMTFMSNWLTDLLYGDAFPLTGPVLSIHIWSGVFVFLGVSVNKWILNENLQHYSSIYLFLGMVANIILNIVMIPKYGIFGAALATLYSQAFSTLLAPLLFKKTRPAFFMMLEALSFTLFKSRKSKI